jgi:hypothetical protein
MMFRCVAFGFVALSLSVASAAAQNTEQKIRSLLDDSRAVFVSLPEADFRAAGQGWTLPDGGRSATGLAQRAPGGAFDPRDLARIPAATLGYQADWFVERYRRYNLDWDITGLRLTSNDPQARTYPTVVIINGGAANFYEFYVDLKNRPGWAQYLAQKLNVMIVTIPGNFKYGGWSEPIMDERRQPAYLLDRTLSADENVLRHVLYTNAVIMQGLKALLTKHTTGDLLIIGHSTSGELSMLAYEDPELRARLKGRYLGWGSGGAARLKGRESVKEGVALDATQRARQPLDVLQRRNADGYSRGYSNVLNPFYQPGMTMRQVAEQWLAAEARRRANFKQPIQDWEHDTLLQAKPMVEVKLEEILSRTGNPWRVNAEDVSKDLFITHYTRLDGFTRMVFMTARYDTNHWDAEDQMKSHELVLAKEYRLKNPNAQVRLINWDLRMTHYGHVELPKELAGATYSVVRWLVR